MSKIEILQLASYVRVDPVEKQGKEWVLNGENNSFYEYIIDRYNGSPTNSAIIDSYSQMIYGMGLNIQIPLFPKKEVRKIVKDFEMFGEACFELMYLNGKPVKSVHVPKYQIAPEKADDDGNITGYWFCYDWSKQNKYPPRRIDAFGFGKGNKRSEIVTIKDYQVGQFYFANPSYLSAMPYAELEEEIANFCINYVKNKFSAGTIINVNNGIPESEDERLKISRQYQLTTSGSSVAGSTIVAFNDNKENSTTVENIQIVDAYQQYDFVSKEAENKICVAHKVVSKAMLGIASSTGFSSNADEIETAFNETMLNVIQPKQEIILDAFQEVANMIGISENILFLPLRPKKVIEETPTQLQLSKAETLIELGENETIEGYELVNTKPVDYEEEDAIKLTSTGTANPNLKSKYDTEFYLYRYRYAGNPAPERDFCVKMMKAGKIYRREDIEAMSNVVVNEGFGMHPTPNNPYSIWLYKGGGLLSAEYTGGTCKHYWEKLTYKKKDVKIDPKSPIAIDDAKKNRASGTAGIAPHDI